MQIDLLDHQADHFIAFLLPCPSGIQWTNQVGGTMCCHPSIEGILIPVQGMLDERDPLLDYAGTYDAELVRRFLSVMELDHLFRPLPDGTTTWNESRLYEAWVPVQVVQNSFSSLEGLVGRIGILTYANSD